MTAAYDAYIMLDNLRWRKESNHCTGVEIHGRIMLKNYFKRLKL
jgi:hypothetical protein